MDSDEMHEVLLRELFNDEVLNTAFEAMSEGDVDAAMDGLITGLHERWMDSSDWEWGQFAKICVHHPLCEMLKEDPFTSYAFDSDGVSNVDAGDTAHLEFIYNGQPPEGTSELGCKVFGYMTNSSVAKCILDRRDLISAALARLADEKPRQADVLAIGAGSLAELKKVLDEKPGTNLNELFGRYVALDADHVELEDLREAHGRYGLEVCPATIGAIVANELELGSFDFIYSTALLDELRLDVGAKLVESSFALLRPGGKLLLASIPPECREIGYMECFMNWRPICRSQREMTALVANIPESDLANVSISHVGQEKLAVLEATRVDQM